MEFLKSAKKFISLSVVLIVLIYGFGYIVEKTFFKLDERRKVEDLEFRVGKVETLISGSEKLDKVLGVNEENLDELIREYKRDNESLKESTRQPSPDGKSYAYLQHKFIKDLKEMNDGDYTYVNVYYDWGDQPVFKSDFRVSSFEWVNDEELVVYRGCGTECTAAYIVNIETKKYRELPMGVGYTWSPNKKYVATYHYSYKYGITVFEKDDIYGRTMFELRREHSTDGSGLIGETKMVWSPDSAKLAVIIEKESEEKLEIIIFNIIDEFSIVFRSDLENKKFSNLHWKNEKTVIFEDGGKLKVVNL